MDIDINQSHQVAAINWIINMTAADRWNLSSIECADLLGLQLNTYDEICEKVAYKRPINLSIDTLERLSLLLGIWKSLQFISPADRMDLAYSIFNRPVDNEIFTGKSIKDFLLADNKLESFYKLRHYLAATIS